MECKASTAQTDQHKILLQLLDDPTLEARAMPLSLLKDITDGFSDDRVIGRGGCAVVYKGIFGGRAVAVKRYRAFMDETTFYRELECLMQAKHKNIVRFLGYCADTQGSVERFKGKHVMADVCQRLLCFEYIANGTLDKLIIDPKREWGICYKIIKEICEGLQNLHDNNIIHLDLKPANILLDDNMTPKITDFGLSSRFDENQIRHITKNIAGTTGYFAPEFRLDGVIARSADLFALGIIMMEILSGHRGDVDIVDVHDSWRDRLGKSKRDACMQIQILYKIALKCSDINPRNRPGSVRDIIDTLHKIESIESRMTLEEDEKEVDKIFDMQFGDRIEEVTLPATGCDSVDETTTYKAIADAGAGFSLSKVAQLETPKSFTPNSKGHSAMALLNGLGHAADEPLGQATEVSGPLANVSRLITRIKQDALTAQQNKNECSVFASFATWLEAELPRRQLARWHLTGQSDTIRPPLQPKAVWQLTGLSDALREAHELIMSCQERSPMLQPVMEEKRAQRFREVQSKLDFYRITLQEKT